MNHINIRIHSSPTARKSAATIGSLSILPAAGTPSAATAAVAATAVAAQWNTCAKLIDAARDAVGAGAQIKIAVTHEVAERPKQGVMALVCIDTSTSMRGERIDAAAHGMATLAGALHHSDVLAVYTFADQSHVEQTFARNYRIDWPAVACAVKERVGGRTALFDAAIAALDALDRYAKPEFAANQTRALVLLTDGDDNASQQHTLADVIARVHANAAVHLLLIGVGVDAAKYARLCSKPHTHFVDAADATPAAIRAAFRAARRIIRIKHTLVINGKEEEEEEEEEKVQQNDDDDDEGDKKIAVSRR